MWRFIEERLHPILVITARTSIFVYSLPFTLCYCSWSCDGFKCIYVNQICENIFKHPIIDCRKPLEIRGGLTYLATLIELLQNNCIEIIDWAVSDINCNIKWIQEQPFTPNTYHLRSAVGKNVCWTFYFTFCNFLQLTGWKGLDCIVLKANIPTWSPT